MNDCECAEKKIGALQEAIRGCNVNMNKALTSLDKMEVHCNAKPTVAFDIGPVTTRKKV